MRLALRAVWRIRLDEVVWKYFQTKKSPFFYFLLYRLFLYSIMKRQSSHRSWRAVDVSMRKTLHGSDFSRFWITCEKKKIEKNSKFFHFISIDLGKSTQLLGTNLQQFLLKNFLLGNETLLQYYHEQVFREVDRTKKLSDAELVVKLAGSSVGERIFRHLNLKFTFPLKRKHMLMGKLEDWLF